MKTKTIIAFYLILLLIGLAIAGFPQGIVNNGGYITATSTNFVKFSGGGDAFLINASADQVTFGHLNVDFTGSGLYKLAITETSFITVNGTLSLSDTLRLQADTVSMASLITNGTISGSYAAVEQYIKPDQWHMVSSPVAAAKADVYTGTYLLKWNEIDSTWAYITSLTDPLLVTRGYFAWAATSISSPTEVEYPGLLNTGNKTVSGLSYTSGAGKGNGWNLVGNPYPCPLEWNSSWTKANIDATVYIYDGTNYLTWNYNLGGFGSMGNGYIPSTQAFWVKANAASPSMTIPNSERTHASQTFYKGSDETFENIFSIEVLGNEYSDKLILGMYGEATDLFDSKYDAYKLFGINEAPQLFAIENNEQLSVDIFSTSGIEKKTVELGFRTGVDGKFELNFVDLENFDKTYSIYLQDKVTSSPASKLIDVRKNPVYKFYANAEMPESRFTLYFKKGGNNGQINLPAKTDEVYVDIYAYNKDVFINYTPETAAEAVIYDLMGREVMRKKLNPQSLNQIPVNAEKGYYIVKINATTTTTTRKVFIN